MTFESPCTPPNRRGKGRGNKKGLIDDTKQKIKCDSQLLGAENKTRSLSLGNQNVGRAGSQSVRELPPRQSLKNFSKGQKHFKLQK